jgi:hypothetical protein
MSKSNFRPIFAVVTVLTGITILATSSCGGSIDFKLFPLEFHFNKNSCGIVPELAQK